MAKLERDLAKGAPDPDERQEAPDAERRAIVRALGASPVILTLLAGRAHAEYRDGVYVPYVPEDDECDPDMPNHPPGQDPQPGCGNDH